MATFKTAGSDIPNHIIFNSGTIDFGNERQVNVDNVTLALEYALAPLFVLGSIKPQNYARHTQKVTITAKIKNFSPGMMALSAGSSSGSNPLSILTLDGQASTSNPVASFYDAAGTQYQYQFTNAVFKSSKANFRAEDYGEFDFEMEASDITILSGAAI